MEILFLVLFMVAVIIGSHLMKKARLKKSVSDAKRHKVDVDNLVNKQFDFHTNRLKILSTIRSKLSAKQYRSAVTLASEYLETGDEELRNLYDKGVIEMNLIGMQTSHRAVGLQLH